MMTLLMLFPVIELIILAGVMRNSRLLIHIFAAEIETLAVLNLHLFFSTGFFKGEICNSIDLLTLTTSICEKKIDN